MRNPTDIDGWMNPTELAWLSKQALGKLVVVEFGSWQGRSTAALLMGCSGTVYAVDAWDGMIDGKLVCSDIYKRFTDNFISEIRSKKLIPLCTPTDNVLAYTQAIVGKVDMLFIDADHSYEGVKLDIEIARKLLSPAGLLCGHDYSNDYPGVKQAVDESVPNHGRIEGGDIWWENKVN